MKKKDLVLGNTYVVAALIVGGHSFKVGTEVTYIYDDGSSSPKFKDEVSGDSQYVSVKDLEPVVTSELSWVPEVGEKYEVTNNQSALPQSIWASFHIGTIVTCTEVAESPNHNFKDETGFHQYLRVGQIKPVPTELEKAEAALKVAEDNLKKLQDKAKAEAEALLKFTEADVKDSFVVEHDSSRGGLRLVVLSNEGGVTFLDSKGKQTNSCSRKRLVAELNMMYKKTDKTLKDFCNA